MRTLIASAAATLLSAGSAHAATIEYLPHGFLLTDLSLNGTRGCGNVQGDGSFETFRWTTQNAPVRLGRPTVSTIGVGGGSPDISYDGTRVSAMMLSSDNMATIGIWDINTGWAEAMPPLPPGGAILDQVYSACWGLSGDGTTATGYYYAGSPVRAWACTWTPSGGVVALEQNHLVSARVNAANFDGSVVVGWEDTNGPWAPVAWRNGTRIYLDPIPDTNGQGWAVNANGETIVGSARDPAIATRGATIWRWNGSAYIIQRIGVLPGTALTLGQAYLESVTDDGQTAVGSNIYSLSPGGPRDAIIWSASGGLQKGTDFINGLGLALPPDTLSVPEFTAISPDGSTITGIAMTNSGFQSFVIRLTPACPEDMNGDGSINTIDLTMFLAQFGQTVPPSTGGDFTGDGAVNTADLVHFLGAFGQSC